MIETRGFYLTDNFPDLLFDVFKVVMVVSRRSEFFLARVVGRILERVVGIFIAAL